MGQYSINLSEEQEKALLTNMMTIQSWIDNAIHNKARQCIDKVCEEALEDETDTILTRDEKGQIVAALATQGRVITTVKQMPESIKRQVVQLARVKSATERQAEFDRQLRRLKARKW